MSSQFFFYFRFNQNDRNLTSNWTNKKNNVQKYTKKKQFYNLNTSFTNKNTEKEYRLKE